MKGFLLVITAFSLVLTACSDEGDGVLDKTTDDPIEAESGGAVYAELLMVNGSEYLIVGNTTAEDEYTVGERLGEVQMMLPAEETPEADFSSNFLSEGTAIFAVEGNEETILAENPNDDGYYVLEQMD